MKYFEAPNKIDYINDEDYLFLAGSITGAENWQQKAAKELLPYINIINPRRSNFNVLDPKVEEDQITWEWRHLNAVDKVLFWFSHETLAPITLFEYGKELVRQDKEIFVGIHPDYKRKNDVIIQTQLELPSLAKKIVFSLDELIEQVKIM